MWSAYRPQGAPITRSTTFVSLSYHRSKSHSNKLPHVKRNLQFRLSILFQILLKRPFDKHHFLNAKHFKEKHHNYHHYYYHKNIIKLLILRKKINTKKNKFKNILVVGGDKQIENSH